MASGEPLQKSFLEEINEVFVQLGHDVLGIVPKEAAQADAAGASDIIEKLVRVNLELRNEFRNQKNWKMADQIRDELKEAGITLKDRPDGSTDWKIEN